MDTVTDTVKYLAPKAGKCLENRAKNVLREPLSTERWGIWTRDDLKMLGWLAQKMNSGSNLANYSHGKKMIEEIGCWSTDEIEILNGLPELNRKFSTCSDKLVRI
eukprot:26609_1